MRRPDGWRMALGLSAVLLAGGCALEPTGSGEASLNASSPSAALGSRAGAHMAFSPRSVGDTRVDFGSLRAMVESPAFRGKTNEALALAFHRYLASTNDGAWQFWAPDESGGRPQARGPVADPVKLLNAYGWMSDSQQAATLYALYCAAGMPARQFGIPGQALCEVYYDSRWHVLDTARRVWFRAPEGHIAGACELARNPYDLIVTNRNKSIPGNLSDRDLAGYAEMYAQADMRDGQPAGVWPHRATRAHAMDFALRPGETLVRSQRSEGRFPYPESWRRLARDFPAEWRGEPREREPPFRACGNGRWIYEPCLSAESRDFAAGVRERVGLAQTADGLVGAGQCVIPFVSPYPFVARPDVSGLHIAYRDGAWITVRASGNVRLEISDPLGNWQPVPVAATGAEERLDVSQVLEARYAFDVRLTLGPGAQVSKFRFEGCLLTAPVSLPRLDEGVNVMVLRSRDKYGLATVPCDILPDFRSMSAVPLDRQAEIRHGAVRPGITPWQTITPDGSGPVEATFSFDAPADERFAWFYASATVAEGPTNAPPRHAQLEWSCDGGPFRPLAETALDNTPLQWECSVDSERILDRPGRNVRLRVTSDTPIGGVEFVGHLDFGAARVVRPVIVHRWLEGKEEHLFTAPADSDKYWFRCGPNPFGHVIEMRVPSDCAESQAAH